MFILAGIGPCNWVCVQQQKMDHQKWRNKEVYKHHNGKIIASIIRLKNNNKDKLKTQQN